MNEECIENNLPEFYQEEDSEGKTGKPGQVRSYEIGYNDVSNWEQDAKENGLTLGEFVEEWFHEVNDGTMQFSWQTLGGGYGYHGDTITTFTNQVTDGEVVVKDIYGQVMIDEYAPQK